MPNPFAYVELHTRDAAKSKGFYRHLFDWKYEDETLPDGKTYTMIYPGTGFPGGMDGRWDHPSHWLMYVQVDDARASLAKARELGAKVRRDIVEIPEGTFAVIEDPTGAPLGLWQPKEKKQ